MSLSPPEGLATSKDAEELPAILPGTSQLDLSVR